MRSRSAAPRSPPSPAAAPAAARSSSPSTPTRRRRRCRRWSARSPTPTATRSDPTGGTRTISWTLVDGDGIANGGADTLTVTSDGQRDRVNDAPQGTDATCAFNEDRLAHLRRGRFRLQRPAEGDSFAGVVITTLPTNGVLLLERRSGHRRRHLRAHARARSRRPARLPVRRQRATARLMRASPSRCATTAASPTAADTDQSAEHADLQRQPGERRADLDQSERRRGDLDRGHAPPSCSTSAPTRRSPTSTAPISTPAR